MIHYKYNGENMQEYWDQKFDELNQKHWGGELKKIPVFVSQLDDVWGLYFHPSASAPHNEQEIYLDTEMTTYERTNVLLHEMAHHYIFETYGDDFYHHHHKLWKEEMKRVGFKGKITKYYGRYKTKEGE
jgi:predicted SprT family Zn-dependent metalloprotease